MSKASNHAAAHRASRITRLLGPGPTEVAILTAVERHHYLTARQVTRLLYAPGSLSWSQRRLHRLTQHGYLTRLCLPRPTRTGSAPLVYTLAGHGRTLLARQGFDVARRLRLAETRRHGYLFLAHTLAVNDVLIAAALLARTQPGLTLADFVHERDLKRHATRVSLPDGSRRAVVPDAWLDLHWAMASGMHRFPIMLELDRGTTAQVPWRRKVAALVTWAQTVYPMQFQTRALTIAVVATPGPRRRDELLRWTEAELVATGQPAAAALFRVTGLAADQVAPAEFFLAPTWSTPLTPAPSPLLALTGGSP